MIEEKPDKNLDTIPDQDFPVLFDQASMIERCREAIRSAGGNQVVALRAQVPKGTLNNLLRGVNIRISGLYAIAAACDVSLDWLMTGHGPRHPQWHHPAVAEGDIPTGTVTTTTPMPLRRPDSAAQGAGPIDQARLQEAITIVHALVGLHVLSPEETASRIIKTYNILTGQKP